MKTITANIPARKIVKNGKIFEYGAYAQTFIQDDDGVWSCDEYGLMLESDVIDICKKSSNWDQIRTEYFPMVGFHN